MRLKPELAAWLASFREVHGRAPRVLHIGNIANNAYINAKLLNAAGLDCDVLCYDYYHLMGCPEWEDADFENTIQDHFHPDWTSVDLGGFERPRWFAQGPLGECLDYLEARRHGTPEEADRHWKTLGVSNGTRRGAMGLGQARWQSRRRQLELMLRDPAVAEKVGAKLARRFRKGGAWGGLASVGLASMLLAAIFVLRLAHLPWRLLQGPTIDEESVFDERVQVLVRRFREVFPDRTDKLAESELQMYRQVVPGLRSVVRQYDLVQAYATDPILPMLCDVRPYVAFEHGTLRSHTLCNEPICRLTALAYHEADHTFITNGDCLEYARKIGVERYSAMIHPFDESRIRSRPPRASQLHAELGVRHLFLCTLRHDWDIKGTDKYIRALPALAEALGRDFRVIMARWGAQLHQSEALAAQLGVADLIHWIEALPKLRLTEMQKSVDVLFDQIALPHFGATAPEGIAAGIPVLMSYNPESTAWIVAEPAPILSCWTVEDIVRNTKVALDPDWRAEYRERARRWIDEHHCASVVVNAHLTTYRRLLSDKTRPDQA